MGLKIQAPARPEPVTPPPQEPPAAAPEPNPGELAMRNAAAAEQAGDLPRALTQYQIAARYGEPGAAAKVEELRTQLVKQYSIDARTALARQDLDGSIDNWQRVLDLDPNNQTAQLEREHALQLKNKLLQLK